MLTDKERELIEGISECQKNREPDDALCCVDILLLGNPRQEIYDALDPEQIQQLFREYADKFTKGQFKGRVFESNFAVIDGTKDERLMTAIRPEWRETVRAHKELMEHGYKLLV